VITFILSVERHLILFPILEPSNVLVAVTSLTKDLLYAMYSAEQVFVLESGLRSGSG